MMTEYEEVEEGGEYIEDVLLYREETSVMAEVVSTNLRSVRIAAVLEAIDAR